ncbi:hypothetical protein V8C86DRAFT_2837776 [Haematococcus lacustris]
MSHATAGAALPHSFHGVGHSLPPSSSPSPPLADPPAQLTSLPEWALRGLPRGPYIPAAAAAAAAAAPAPPAHGVVPAGSASGSPYPSYCSVPGLSPGAGAGGVEAGGGAGTGAEGVEATGQAEEAGSSAGSMVTSSISTAHCSSGSSLTPAGAHCQAQGGVNAGVTQSETRATEGAQAAASALSWTPPLLLSAELLTAVAKLLGWPEASGAPKAAGGPEATGGPQAGAIPAAGTASEVVAAAGHTPALSADSPSTVSGAMPAAPHAPSPTIDHGCLLQLQQLLLPLLLPVSTSPAAQAGAISSAVEEPAAVETDAGAGAGSGSGSEQQSIPQVSRSLLNWLQDMQAAGHLQPLAAALSVPGCLGSRQTSQLLPLLSAVLTAAPPHVLTHTPATAPDNPATATATATTPASPPAPVLALNPGLASTSALVPPSVPSGSGPAALRPSPLLSLLPLLRSDSGAQALLALLQAEQQRLEQTGLVEQAAAVCAASAATAAARQLQRPPSPAAALGAEATSSHTQASPLGSASQPLAHRPPNLPTTLLHLAGMLQAAPATRSLAGLNVAAPGSSSSSSSSKGSRPSAWPPLLLPLVLDLATALLPDFMEIKLVPRRTAPTLPALAAPAPAALPLAPPVLAPPVLATPALAPPALTAPTVPGALTLAAVPPAAPPAVSTATAADAVP